MKQEALQLTGGNNNGTRRELDFYPTPKEVTISLLNFLNLPVCTIWDPACGNFAMTDVFCLFGHAAIGTDIIYGDDFFVTSKKCDAIITNPPFSLSEQFIVKSLSDSEIVCMLLKSQYWHASKRVKLFEQHPPSFVLPLTWRPDFLEHERKQGDKKGSPTMEVAWSVWLKSTGGPTIYQPICKPKIK